MPMLRSALMLTLVALVSMPLGAATADTAPAPAPAAASTVPPLPETLLLVVVKGLASDDLTGIYQALPPADQAQIADQWAHAQWTPAQSQNLDAFLTSELAPNAVDTFIAAKKDQITAIDLNGFAQKLTMGSALLPMLAGQNGGLTPAQTALMPVIQTLMADLAAWLPTSGINDPAKVRLAAVQVQAAVKALGVTTSAQLKALPLDQLLVRVGLAHHQLKTALVPFGVHTDAFLNSISATSVQDNAANPLHRILTVTCTAFGHAYTVPLPVVYQNRTWRIDPALMPPGLAQLSGGLAPPVQQ